VLRFLRQQKPELRLLVTSAYPGTVPESALVLADRFLHKGAERARFVAAVEDLVGPVSRIRWPLTRRAHRFPLAVPVEIAMMHSGVVRSIPCRSTDLSENGMAVIANDEMLPGEMLKLEFSLPTAAQALSLRGMVRQRDISQYGIEFTDVSPEQRSAIRGLGDYLPPLALPHSERRLNALQLTWR
jgi:hypothetical protein